MAVEVDLLKKIHELEKEIQELKSEIRALRNARLISAVSKESNTNIPIVYESNDNERFKAKKKRFFCRN